MPESDDLRQFMREIAARHERIWREQFRTLEQQRLRMEEGTRALRQVTDELRDTRDERRAHIDALWALVDNLQNGGAQA